MPSQINKDYVNELSEKLVSNPHFCLIDFDSLPHSQMEELRRELQPVTLKILKNSLYKVAVTKLAEKKKINNQDQDRLIADDVVRGPSAMLALGSDWLSGLQTFWKFTDKHEGMVFKVGLLDNKVYDRSDLEKMAQLPSRDVLIGKILGSFKAPQSRTVMSLKHSMYRFVNVLKNVKT